MAEETMPVENGGIREIAVKPPETPKPAVETKTIDLQAIYDQELATYRQNQELLPREDTWKTIEKAAKSSIQTNNEHPRVRPNSIFEKMHRAKLSGFARIQGVKDIGQFNEVVEHIENALYETSAENNSLGTKHIDSIKELSSSNNPVEVIEGLRRIGFKLDTKCLEAPDQVKKLKQLFNTPNAKQALDLVKDLSWNENDWFSENSNIDFLIELANNPNLESVILPEQMHKIDILSKALHTKINPKTFNQLETIADNPDLLEFSSYLVKNGLIDAKSYSATDNIERLNNEGLIKSFITLYRSGADIGPFKDDLTKIINFQNQDQKPEQQMDRDNALGNLHKSLDNQAIQLFIQDHEKQEFAGLLKNHTNSYRLPADPEIIAQINNLFNKRHEAVCSAKFLRERTDQGFGGDFSDKLTKLAIAVSDQDFMNTIADTDFHKYLQNLKQVNYETSDSSFFNGDKKGELVDSFINKSQIYQKLLKNTSDPASVAKIISSEYKFHSLWQLSDLIEISEYPNMLQALNALHNINYRFQDKYEYSLGQKGYYQKIADSPEIIARLESAEVRNLALRLGNDLGWRICNDSAYTGLEDLFKISDDKKLQEQLFNPAYSEFVRERIPNLDHFNMFSGLGFDHAKYRDAINIIRSCNITRDQQLVVDCLNAEAKERKPETIINLINSISKTTSFELRELKSQLIPIILRSSQPELELSKIKDVFEKNNLPYFVKQFKVFEILFLTPDAQGDTEFNTIMKYPNNFTLTPVLKDATRTRRLDTFFKDLLKTHIESGDPNLKTYLVNIKSGQALLDKVEAQGTNSLSETESQQLTSCLNKLSTAYEHSLLGKRNDKQGDTANDISLSEKVQRLKSDLQVKNGQKITDRIVEMFARPLGYNSVEEILSRMNLAKQEANERNKSNPNIQEGKLVIHAGDLLKGINSDIFSKLLRSGAISQEFLGKPVARSSNNTYFDIDFSMVTAQDAKGDLPEIIASSRAIGYGNIIFLVKDRGQFMRTDLQTNVDKNYDTKHYELFHSHSDHPENKGYGVRTSMPSTEIDAIIFYEDGPDQLTKEEIFFNIANNGFYIPVVNNEGDVIFTESDYNSYRLNTELIQSELKYPEFKPEKLMEVLKSCPYFSTLYEMSAGVGEGYSTGQHTKMVMDQFEKYFANRELPGILTKEEFRIMFALHDIGKPIAESKRNKDDQHEYTKRILTYAFQTTGISENKIETITSLIDHDIFGDFFKGKLNPSDASRQINDLAQTIGIPPKELLETIKIFYICDAGAYTEDAGGKKSLDDIFYFDQSKKVARFSEIYESKFQELVRLIS